MDDLTLPPLPTPDYSDYDFDAKEFIEAYSEEKMREYAKQAVEAEREACAYVAEQAFRYALDGYEVADRIRARSLD